MLFKNKRLKELEEIKKQRLLLEKEKEELIKINERMLNTNNPDFIDISNVYVWTVNGVKNIVELKEKKIIGRALGGLGPEVKGYYSVLIDIFTEKIIYEKSSTQKIGRHEFLGHGEMQSPATYAKFYPLAEEEMALLEYPNKKVPRYIMYKVFYKINNIDITNSKLEKLPKIKFLEKNK